ncbi:MAG: RimK family protein [Gammaproteobacteria bacterium]
MSHTVLLVENPKQWAPSASDGEALPCVAAVDYLGNADWSRRKGLRLINLCPDHDYLDMGYYSSLLAEARGHRVLPSVRTINDLAEGAQAGVDLDELNRRVKRVLNRRKSGLESTRLELLVAFGNTRTQELKELARSLFEAFPAPLLRIVLEKEALWRVADIRIASPAGLESDDAHWFTGILEGYLGKRWRVPRERRPMRYEMAILHNPEEKLPPSDRRALAQFVKAARAEGIDAELITAEDYPRLAEFDALFIRETTAVSDHTYRFARRAEREGLVVMDDPRSILRCTNKIYLAECLKGARIPTPKTVVVTRGELPGLIDDLGFPMVLKVPDGSFSRGVIKVEDEAALKRGVAELFKDSELILAQAFEPTEFDWRIGVLAGQALYACQYGMAPGHWQIIDHQSGGKHPTEGDHRTLAVQDTPADIIELARRAAAVMGDGLYGVDIKQTAKGAMVIEVNDNPSLDVGVEDQVLGEELYRRIMREFVRRLEARGVASLPGR